MKSLRHALLLLLILPVYFWPSEPRGNTNPAFYLATDRSFTDGETPYVNLEASGYADVEFRLYRVNDPQTFFLKHVQARLVRPETGAAFANPFALARESWAYFKNDMRTLARAEFHPKTRSLLRQTAGIDYTNPGVGGDLAKPALLKEHEFLRSFSVPTIESHWAYRRVPVPVGDNGIYLVEAIYGKNVAYTVLVKSGLTFLTKQGDEGTVVFAAHSATGDPVSGADVDMFDANSGARFGGGRTASDGIFRFKGNTPNKSLILLRKSAEDEAGGTEYALSDPDFFSSSFYGQGGPRVYLYTDRPIYRPGDEVFFKAIARDFSGNDYRPLAGGATFTVLDEKGDVIVNNRPANLSGNMGTADGTFTLPAGDSVNLGTYNVILNTRGSSFSSEFRVDAYRKPKFRVRVNTTKRTYGKSDNVPVRISAAYYYGKALSGVNVNVRVFRTPKFDYSPVGHYNFEAASAYLDATGGSTSRELVLDETKTLGSDGDVSLTIRPEKIDQDYDYSILASVTAEDSTITGTGRFSVNRSPFYIKVLRDNQVFGPGETAEMIVQLVPYDSSLSAEDVKKLIGGRSVDGVLYQRSFYWISEERERKQVASTSAKTDDSGRAKIAFKVPESGHYVASIEASAPDGSETTNDVTLWASGRQDTIEMPVKNLTLTAGKDLYKVGETAEVLIVSPVENGHVFVSLEGSQLYHQETVKLNGNTHRYRVKITEGMSPNFVFSAALFHGGDAYKNELKVVAPPQDRFLKVTVESDKQIYRPGDQVDLTVRTVDANGRGVPSEVSLGVVDAALYQLQSDPTPAMAKFFYHPRRNNVLTNLSSAFRFFGYSEEKRLELALNRRSGAFTAIKDSDDARKDFKDQTFWNAKVTTAANGEARVSFKLADNLTEWKVTARAVTRDTRVGESTHAFVARKDLQIQAGIPPYLLRDREQTIAASVSNLTKEKQDITVSVTAENGKLTGDTERRLSLDPGGSAPVYFKLQTGSGDAMQLRLKAAAGRLYDISEHNVKLKPFGLQRTVAGHTVLESGDDSESTEVNLPEKNARPRLSVRLNPGSGLAVRQSLVYLADYPYGCIEQTMSRFMPVLAAKQAGYVTPRLQRELPEMVQWGIARLRQMQNTDGGFGWYGENQASDALMSAYVFRGLAISKRLGYDFEDKMLDRARSFLYQQLAQQSFTPFERAYILFSLSEGGKIEASMMEAALKEIDASEQTQYGRALVALTLINQNRPTDARKLIDKLLDDTDVAEEKTGLLFTQSAHIGNYGAWEEDNIEMTAAILTAAVRLKMDGDIQENLAATLLVNRRGYYYGSAFRNPDGSANAHVAWKNSRDTAWAVLALTEKLKATRETLEDASLNVTVNGQAVKRFTVSAATVDAGETLIEVPAQNLKSGNNQIKIEKEGGPAVYASAMLTFYDGSDSFSAQEVGLSISRSYEIVKVSRSNSGELSIHTNSSRSFEQGDLVMVSLRVASKSPADDYYQIEDAIPPGFSVMQNDAEYYSSDRLREYAARQIYDDRAVFFTRGPVKNFTIRYFLRANLPGEYRAVPAKALIMYYPELHGLTSDDTLRVAER